MFFHIKLKLSCLKFRVWILRKVACDEIGKLKVLMELCV